MVIVTTSRRNRPQLAANREAVELAEVRRFRTAALRLFGAMSEASLRLRGGDVLRFLTAYGSDLGLSEANCDLDIDEMKARAWPTAVRHLVSKVRLPRGTPASRLERKLDWLANTLCLSPLESEILGLFARVDHSRIWKKMLNASDFSTSLDVESLSLLSDTPAHEVERVLMAGAPLLRTGLITDDGDGDYSLGSFVQRLQRLHNVDPSLLTPHMLPVAPPSRLDWSDVAHLGALRDTAEAAVRGATALGDGVNILLHGVPGTGKTEFARLLADRCGLIATFAGLADDEGAEPDRSARLSHLTVLRALTERTATHLIIVDEADDVLSLDGEGRQRRSKLWLNRLVEEVHTPTVWITNDPSALGDTIVRRMHLAIGFTLPPVAVRVRVVTRAAATTGLVVNAEAISSAAALPVAPAVLTNAVQAACLAGGNGGDVRRAGEGILTAMGGRPPMPNRLPAAYDPALARADQDLPALADRLVASARRGWSLLLAGASGTGKSAYARHLAARLGIEVEEKRGSDLLGAFVGETEANIAAAFREAGERGALLLIDEADTFLFDRRDAHRSWETSMVSEMLRWMGGLSAPFIATTNLTDRLDPATQRRFSFRIDFKPLLPSQAAELFERRLGVRAAPSAAWMDNVTPGDIAVVADRAELLDERDPQTLVRWLRREVDARGESLERAGFHSQ